MAWTFKSGLSGSASSKTAGTTLNDTSRNIDSDVGDVLFVGVGFDNTQTTDGETNEVLSVTDGPGNVYTKVAEYVNGNGSAGAGVGASLWYSIHTSALVDGANLIATFANTITAKAMWCQGFTKVSTNVVRRDGYSVNAGDNIDPPSMDISGLVSKEYLWIRAIAFDADVGGAISPGATANFTGFSAPGTPGGAEDSNITVWGEYRIFTGSSNPSDPGDGAAGQNWNTASVYAAMTEGLPIFTQANQGSDELIRSARFKF